MRHLFGYHELLLALLALSQLAKSESKGQCDNIKRTKIVKRHLDALKALRDDLQSLGCQRKEKIDEKAGDASLQPSTLTTLSSTKRVTEGYCSKFTPIENNINKNITCFLSDVDIEKGLDLEKLISSKLCTDIIMFVRHTYDDVPAGISTFQYLNQTRDSANVEKWRSMNLRIFMQIGSWDDQKRMNGPQFSRLAQFPIGRERFATTLAKHLQKGNFDGLLFSWYYPGCVRDDCTIGPASDGDSSAKFFKRLNELIIEKSIKAKIMIEMSIKKDNIYMGVQLSEIVKYVDVLLLENTSPENRVMFGKNYDSVFVNPNNFYTQFGVLDLHSENVERFNKGIPKASPVTTLLELETTTVYSTVVDKRSWRLKNITAKNLCKLVISASTAEYNRTTQLMWPLSSIQKETTKYLVNDFDYIKARVKHAMNISHFGGVWIRDLWADDMENECNCGAFPILRAANEALGRSTCKMPNNCPTVPPQI